jgi:hypothetical protein
MKIELLFDENTFRKQMKLLYNLAYEKELKYYKNAHYLGFVFLIFGILIIYDKRDLGYLLVFFGLVILIPYFNIYFKHFKMSKKYELEEKKIIVFYKGNPKTFWEFTDDLFKYSDFNTERNMEWKDFLTYRIIEDNLFMFTKNNEPFIIGKSEIAEESYKEVLEIVERKISK